MNISTNHLGHVEKLSQIFHLLSQPARLNILLAIGENEVCVCHLEVFLKERQAYISQQLMFLKDGGLVDFRREGRNIYYHLVNKELLNIVRATSKFCGGYFEKMERSIPVPGCPCPQCNPGLKDCLSDTQDETNKEPACLLSSKS